MIRSRKSASSVDYHAVFGRNLRAARLQAGLSQLDVVARTGGTQQRLSLTEAGKQNVTLRTMVILADAVGCSLPKLLIEPASASPAERQSLDQDNDTPGRGSQ